MRHMRTQLKSLMLFLIGIICILPICAIVFTSTAVASNLIPIHYIIIADVVVTIITGVAIFLCIKLGDIGKICSAAFSLLISISLCLGTYFIVETSATLKDITNSEDYYDQVSVVTLANSDLTTINDMSNHVLGVQYKTQPDVMAAGIDKIQSTYNIQFESIEYDNISTLVDALLNNEVDAIIYNSTYTQLLAEEIEGFDKMVKVLVTCDLTFQDIDKYHDMVKDNTVIPPPPTEDNNETIQPNEPTLPHEPENSDVFAVYLSGIDVYGSISLKSRSDVNIIAIVNPKEYKVLLVTTPRDYFVPIPGVSNGKPDKLTHAGIYGVQASMDTLGELYGINLDYYFRVNFTSFEKIVDALGGVDVYSEYSFSTRGYSFNKGNNHVNGAAALVFARERYSFAAGDNQRGKNQQQLIKAIIQKACSPAILTAAGEILDSVRANIDTNIPEEMIQDMIRNQLSDNREWQVEMLAATGTGDYDEPYSMPGFNAYVMVPNQESVSKIKEAIQAMYE